MDNKKIGIHSMTPSEVDTFVREHLGGHFTREYYPFGKHPTYELPGVQMGMVYGGYLYISPKGQFHPEVRDSLRENWLPLTWEDQAWKRNNL